MTRRIDDDCVDADRWLYVHQDQVVGARSAEAVQFVLDAGLVPHVARFGGVAPSPGVPDPGRVRLVIGDDGRIRGAIPG